MNSIPFRIFFSVLLLYALFVLPWWMISCLLIIGMFLFPFFAEYFVFASLIVIIHFAASGFSYQNIFYTGILFALFPLLLGFKKRTVVS